MEATLILNAIIHQKLVSSIEDISYTVFYEISGGDVLRVPFLNAAEMHDALVFSILLGWKEASLYVIVMMMGLFFLLVSILSVFFIWRRLEARFKRRRQALAVISHELRTPLNGVVGILDMLAKSNLNMRQKDLVWLLQQSTLNLLSVANNVLDIARLDAVGAIPIYQSIDLVEWVENSCQDP